MQALPESVSSEPLDTDLPKYAYTEPDIIDGISGGFDEEFGQEYADKEWKVWT